MKKLISLLICIGIIFTIFSFNAAADSGCKIGCGHISDAAGRIVSVPVSVSSDNGIYVIRIIADYDETALTFVKIEKNYENKLNYTVNDKDGKVTVVADAREIENVETDGEMFKIQFEIKDNAKNGTYPIKISGDSTMIEENGSGFKAKGLNVSFSSGSVKVICKEHNFNVEVKGGKKCADCDSIKQSSGQVVAPVIKNENDKEENEVYIEPGKTIILDDYQSSEQAQSEVQKGSDNEKDENITTKEYTGTVGADGDSGVGNEETILTVILAVLVGLIVILTIIFIKKFKKVKKEAE